jgi:hypothetical protein
VPQRSALADTVELLMLAARAWHLRFGAPRSADRGNVRNG